MRERYDVMYVLNESAKIQSFRAIYCRRMNKETVLMKRLPLLINMTCGLCLLMYKNWVVCFYV